MRYVLVLSLAFATAACNNSRPAADATPDVTPVPNRNSMPTPTTNGDVAADAALFDFAGADGSDWEVVNDGVMGGLSKGYLETEGDVLRFTGTLVTRGGGFTSVRTEREMDLSDFTGLELRVRGGGRDFEINVVDGQRVRGRRISRRTAFPTTDEWTVVRLPFGELQASWRGRQLDVAPVNPADVRELGIFMADGQDGPFRLEVDYIRGYR